MQSSKNTFNRIHHLISIFFNLNSELSFHNILLHLLPRSWLSSYVLILTMHLPFLDEEELYSHLSNNQDTALQGGLHFLFLPRCSYMLPGEKQHINFLTIKLLKEATLGEKNSNIYPNKDPITAYKIKDL